MTDTPDPTTANGHAAALVEALPFIQRFQGRTVVVKLGGAAIESGDVRSVLADVALLHVVGVRVVLVHGGGPEISAWQERLGITTTFVDGLRVTDAQTVEIARMVLTGKIGPSLVAAIHDLGGAAVGLSGEDGPTIYAVPRRAASGVDLGFVGDVDYIDSSLISTILDSGRIPVVASIGLGSDGHPYNINADTVAAELAATLNAEKLILLTDVNGIRDAGGSLIPEIDAVAARGLISDGVITGGMIPKVAAALRAVDTCAASHIIDGRVEHALLLELLTATGVGTMITRSAA